MYIVYFFCERHKIIMKKKNLIILNQLYHISLKLFKNFWHYNLNHVIYSLITFIQIFY
jgi:hypothetical protein